MEYARLWDMACLRPGPLCIHETEKFNNLNFKNHSSGKKLIYRNFCKFFISVAILITLSRLKALRVLSLKWPTVSVSVQLRTVTVGRSKVRLRGCHRLDSSLGPAPGPGTVVTQDGDMSTTVSELLKAGLPLCGHRFKFYARAAPPRSSNFNTDAD
eukprot:g70135.t1